MAFMAGMDRGIVIGAVAMLISSVLAFFLVDDRVVRGEAGPQAETPTGEGVAVLPVEALEPVQAGD
jgi:hypothetical protein